MKSTPEVLRRMLVEIVSAAKTISWRAVDLVIVVIARRVRREPLDVSRASLAFFLSFVLAATIGTLALPDPGRKLSPKVFTGPVPITPSLHILPGMPSVAGPRNDALLKHYEDASSLSTASAITIARDLRANRMANGSVGVRQTTAVPAALGNGARGRVVRVTTITLWGNSSRPWVSISASGPVRYRLRNVEPDWVVVDISRAQLTLASGQPPVGRGLVRQVRAGQFASDVVRVVLELAEPVPVHVAMSTNQTSIVVSLAAEERDKGSLPSTPGQQLAAVLNR